REFTNQEFDIDDQLDKLEFDSDGNLIDASSDSEEEEPERKKTKQSKPVIKCYQHHRDQVVYLASLCQLFELSNVNVLAKSKEKYIQIEMEAQDFYIPKLKTNYHEEDDFKSNTGNRKVNIRFMDVFNFLPFSLAKLADNLEKDRSELLPKIIMQVVDSHLIPKKVITNYDENSISHLLQKLPYPHTFLSGPEKLHDSVQIPGKEFFSNELKNEMCSDEKYQHI
ncbi:unnamed protein product, partial [Allacma fusca]